MIARLKLKHKSIELFEALERSWEIANNDWLPAIGSAGGSYNSYPHIRNLEQYLDDLLLKYCEGNGNSCGSFELSAAELYIILASILLHDLGKAISKKFGHGSDSRKLIDAKYADLGIPSAELARSIGKICEYHEPKSLSKINAQLRTIRITQYGRVRERELAGLLALIDQLDSAYTRVVPMYLFPNDEIGVVGRFRREIKAVRVDSVNQMICTCLGDFVETAEECKASDSYIFSLKPGVWRTQFNGIINELKELFDDGTKLNNIRKKISSKKKGFKENEVPRVDNKKAQNSSFLCPELLYRIKHDVANAMNVDRGDSLWRFTLCQALASREILCVKRPVRKSAWSPKAIIAIILSNLSENNRKLQNISGYLRLLGIDLLEWYIEYDDHLYNKNGREVWEPIFSKKYLLDIAKQMWALSTSLFGDTQIGYRELAAACRERDVLRVITSVKRIAQLVSGNDKTGYLNPCILAHDDSWQWYIENPDGRKCRFWGINDVKEIIKGN